MVGCSPGRGLTSPSKLQSEFSPHLKFSRNGWIHPLSLPYQGDAPGFLPRSGKKTWTQTVMFSKASHCPRARKASIRIFPHWQPRRLDLLCVSCWLVYGEATARLRVQGASPRTFCEGLLCRVTGWESPDQHQGPSRPNRDPQSNGYHCLSRPLPPETRGRRKTNITAWKGTN